jgi:hypothetical protein
MMSVYGIRSSTEVPDIDVWVVVSVSDLSSGRSTMSVPDLAALAAYLRKAGWTLEDRDERTSLWRPRENGPNGEMRVVLPATGELSGYADRALEALRTIAYVERRSIREVVEDISSGGSDTVSVRLTPDTPPGEAPLNLA